MYLQLDVSTAPRYLQFLGRKTKQKTPSLHGIEDVAAQETVLIHTDLNLDGWTVSDNQNKPPGRVNVFTALRRKSPEKMFHP